MNNLKVFINFYKTKIIIQNRYPAPLNKTNIRLIPFREC